MAEYKASDADRELEIVNLASLEAETAKIMSKGAFGYIQGGAGDEWTMRRNLEAFNDRQIKPRVLADVEKPDIRTSILGIDLTGPVIMVPLAAQGLAHVDAEKATAKAVAEAGSIMCLSSYANTSIADVAKAGGGAPQWFQLYMSKDDGFNKYLLDEAVNNGAKAIILTADATVGGNREADTVNHFTFPLPMVNLEKFSGGQGKGEGISAIYAKALQRIKPSDVAKVASMTNLPVIAKGVQTPEDAYLAMGAGAAAVYVSNHGGRQLDGGPGSFDVLESITNAVRGRVPVIFDSGIRRGHMCSRPWRLARTWSASAVRRSTGWRLAGPKACFRFSSISTWSLPS